MIIDNLVHHNRLIGIAQLVNQFKINQDLGFKSYQNHIKGELLESYQGPQK